MNNLKLKIQSQKNIIILALIFVMPFTMYLLFVKGISIDNYKITQITSYFFAFKIFYLFCFNLLFNLNNKKNTFITFFIFLIIGILSVLIPSSEFTFKDIMSADNNFIFFVHTILNKNLFLDIIFFIMTALSFNEYKNYKNISEVFTFSFNMIIYSVFYSIFSSVIFMIVFVFIINLLKNFFINTFSDTSLIINTFVLFIFYIFAFTPFIIYSVYKKDMKDKNISIYFSRIMMYISLYNIVKYLFTMYMPYNNPYDIRINFILYNVAITIGAVNLFFVRIDYKASIFTKVVYIIFPITAFIFNIIIFSSLIYRIKEYGISPNKLTLIFTNMIILVHFILIIIDNIKSLKKLGSIKNIKDIILTNNRSYYVYVYGIIAFIICFIMPLFYSQL